MPDPSLTKSLVAEFFATARGRLITWLTVLVLLLGVVAEVISIATGYYNLIKAKAEAQILTGPNGLSYLPPAACRRQDSKAKGGTGYPDGVVPQAGDVRTDVPCP